VKIGQHVTAIAHRVVGKC